MLEKYLEKLNFSPSEITVYMNLLSNGSSYAANISRKTKINRTNVYEALDRLIAKGVVGFVVKNNVKWFQANDQKSLLKILERREEEVSDLKSSLKKELKKSCLVHQSDNKLEAVIFVGKKGLRSLFEEVIDAGKPISLIASQLQFKSFFGPYFELWHKKRIKRKIKQRSIFSSALKKQLKKRQLLSYKFVDNTYLNPSTTIIYGHTTLFIQWSKEPIAIKIDTKEITRSHKNYFNLLWEKAKDC